MNISIYKSFAINAESAEIYKDILEKEFSIIFIDHESSYIGLYSKTDFLNSTLGIYNNYNEIEEEWYFPDHKMLNIVVSVSISHGKKKERLETDEIICTKLINLGFQLMKTYTKDSN